MLFRSAVSSESRNYRSEAMSAGKLPPLPLELRYIITPWAQKPRDSHRIIGAVAKILYQNSILYSGQLLGGIWAPDDSVQLILESIPVEEHYDIWEPTDIPYRLSLTYLARLVGIDAGPVESNPPVAAATFPEQEP